MTTWKQGTRADFCTWSSMILMDSHGSCVAVSPYLKLVHDKLWASLVAQMIKNVQRGRPGFDSWFGKIPWSREQLPTPVFWREYHGLYRSWSHKVSHTDQFLFTSNSKWQDYWHKSEIIRSYGQVNSRITLESSNSQMEISTDIIVKGISPVLLSSIPPP